MRKVKKFAALLLCGALTLSALTGCGGDDGGSSKESSSAPEESKAEESKAEDAGGEAEDAGGEAEDAGGEAASGDAVHFTFTAYNCIAGKEIGRASCRERV